MGNRERVKALIAAGADVNARDKDGTTALMLAKSDDVRAALSEGGATGEAIIATLEKSVLDAGYKISKRSSLGNWTIFAEVRVSSIAASL
jgi:hypothetical protein